MIVATIRPPMTTIASGFWTSAPRPVARAIGTKPIAGTMPVIRTARTRSRVPSTIASSTGRPASIRWRTLVITTRPLRTVTPDSTINPTAAEIENGNPARSKPNAPPARPRGTAE